MVLKNNIGLKLRKYGKGGNLDSIKAESMVKFDNLL